MNEVPTNQLATVTHESPICSVCHSDLHNSKTAFDTFLVAAVAIAKPCGHEFHADCIAAWLNDHLSCPIGRRTVTSLEIKLPLPPDWQSRMVKAAQYGDLEMVKTLLHRGADVNAGRSESATPFAFAAENNHLDVALELASRGATDPTGQDSLGMMYLSGEGVEKNSFEAIKWFQKAAEQNFPEAHYNLGHMYMEDNEQDISPDLAKAEDWLLKAVNLGVVPAMNSLGYLYLFGGTDFPADLAKAEDWLLKAVNLGDVPAMNNLGFLYSTGGKDFPADLGKAEYWLLKAANHGCVPAMNWLSDLYKHGGKGFPADPDKARHWLLKAINPGNVAP